MTISSGTVSADVVPAPSSGTFTSSAPTAISVTTDNCKGYVLSIKADSSSANATSLVNVSDSTKSIASLVSPISEIDFSASSNTQYNNKWGYRPSKHNSVSNTNTYYPAPTIDGDILDETSGPNATANTYTLSIGAKIDSTITPGTYEGVFVITAVVNPTPYSITYNANAGTDTVTNMPSPNPDTSSTYDDYIILNSAAPERDGYNFVSWCTDGGSETSCSGDSYDPGGTYPINQLSNVGNTVTLYAIWKEQVAECSTPIPLAGITYMQDINNLNEQAVLASMENGAQYGLVDSRDDKTYCVAKLADGNIWMTQNLDFDIVVGGMMINSTNTDVPSDWSNAGLINDTYSSLNTSWKDSNTSPESYDPGDLYWSGVLENNALASTGDPHYHIGNYYNWSAAILARDSSGFSRNYQDAEQSICPAGWTLPKAGQNTGPGSFAYLIEQQNMTIQNAHLAPAYFNYSGNWWNSSFNGVGFVGNYLSSVTGSEGEDYVSTMALYATLGYIRPASDNGRGSGLSIRCVTKQPKYNVTSSGFDSFTGAGEYMEGDTVEITLQFGASEPCPYADQENNAPFMNETSIKSLATCTTSGRMPRQTTSCSYSFTMPAQNVVFSRCGSDPD